MSIFTHNGKFTIKSLRTGEHRTFQVRTQPDDAGFAPGKRILYLLIGSDNVNEEDDGRGIPGPALHQPLTA